MSGPEVVEMGADPGRSEKIPCGGLPQYPNTADHSLLAESHLRSI